MFKFSLMTAAAYAAAGTDYTKNGANWGETDAMCDAGREQSPINLTKGVPNNNLDLELSNY